LNVAVAAEAPPDAAMTSAATAIPNNPDPRFDIVFSHRIVFVEIRSQRKAPSRSTSMAT
jgi:hypothetical protein